MTSSSPRFSPASRVVASGMLFITSRLTLGVLRQKPSNASSVSSTPGLNDTNLYGPAPTGAADFFDIAFRHHPAGAGGAAVKGQKIRPGMFQDKADMAGIGGFDRRDPVLHQRRRRAAIALVGELDVLRGDRLAVVEAGALAQHEIVVQPGIGFTSASCSA